LLLGALLWGNCLCCPQAPFAPAPHISSHGCCGQPANPSDSCHSFALKYFVQTDAAAYTPQAATDNVPSVPTAVTVAIVAIPHSPSNLEVLNSTIRI
jgi:hypothetical protein